MNILSKLSFPFLMTAFGIVGLPFLGAMYLSKAPTNGTSGHLGFVFGVLALLAGSVGAVVIGLPIGLLTMVPLWITMPVSYYLTLFVISFFL